MLIDVHAHLDHALIRHDLDRIIRDAKSAGIHCVITNGIDRVTNRLTLEISKKFDIVRPALGIYPPDALKREIKEAVESGYFGNEDGVASDFDINEELEFIEDNISQAIAVGEIGLDYKTGDDRKQQMRVFERQIEIAIKSKKPIIVHSRKAEYDVLDILEKYGYKKTILHCFSGKKALIKRAVGLGLSFSVPTSVVRAEHFQNLVRMVPLTRLHTETDAPYMSPFRDKVNEPAFVIEALKKIAEIKGIGLDEAKKAVFMNFKSMF